MDRLLELLEQTAHIALDGIKTLNFLVIVHEHVRVHLVDKYFIADITLYPRCVLDHLIQLLASAFIVCIVSINNIDKGSAVANVLCRIAFEHKIAREVDDAKLDIVIVSDGLGVDSACGQQEEGLVR